MVDQALANDGDRLEAAMWMRGETGHLLAVVHPPAIPGREIHADVAPRQQRTVRTQASVAARIQVFVEGAEDEGADAGQAAFEGLGAQNQGGTGSGGSHRGNTLGDAPSGRRFTGLYGAESRPVQGLAGRAAWGGRVATQNPVRGNRRVISNADAPPLSITSIFMFDGGFGA
jgi:hypothetical protein